MKRIHGEIDILRAGSVALAGDHSIVLASPPPHSSEPFEEKDWDLFGTLVEVLADAGVNVTPLIDYEDEWALKDAIYNDIVVNVQRGPRYGFLSGIDWDVEEVIEFAGPPLPADTQDWPLHDYADDLLRRAYRQFLFDPLEYQCAMRVSHTIAGMRVARHPEERRIVTAIDMGEAIEYQFPKTELKELRSFLRARRRW